MLRSLQGKQFKRFLNLHEYQSKELMNRFGLNTQRFKVIENAQDSAKAAQELSKLEQFRLLLMCF